MLNYICLCCGCFSLGAIALQIVGGELFKQSIPKVEPVGTHLNRAFGQITTIVMSKIVIQTLGTSAGPCAALNLEQ